MGSYSVVDVDEGPGGAVRKLRRALGARAFGFELLPGRALCVAPAARRQPVAGEQGLEFLTIGAPLGRLYEPPSWG